MTTFADQQFLWDWAQERARGRQRYALVRTALSPLLVIWVGVNMAVRGHADLTLLFWTIVWGIFMAVAAFFGSQTAFDANEKNFTALLQKGEAVPASSPRNESRASRYAVLAVLVLAAIFPIAFALIMQIRR